MTHRRVVVTGVGLITPVGNTVETSWNNIVNGVSGIAHIDKFDVSAYAAQIGGSIKDFDVGLYLEAKEARRMDEFIQYGIAAGVQAVEDAGLKINDDFSGRVGCAIGSGIGGIKSIEENTHIVMNKGPRKISPFFVPGSIINMVAGNLSIRYNMKGPNIAVTTACTTSTHNIGLAARMIAYGDADVMLAGGAEMATTPTGLGGFSAARALSTRNDSPEEASRPWDVDRDGFVLSDGAGVMVLEEYEVAKKRGAKIYAELSGFGMSADAYHMTSPPENGEGAANSMKNAIRDAGLNPEDISYINAHGTSTKAGDLAECNAVKTVLGDAVKSVAMSSTKSMIGHLLGASGAVEAIYSVLAIRDQVAPPTINLHQADQGCDFNLVPNTAQEMTINTALSNSFGFGGTNASLVFSKV